MERIYHTWDKWECYPAGLYETTAPDGVSPDNARRMYAEFLRDDQRFEAGLKKVLRTWVRSCEHYLSNEKMNRVAWLGQASMCATTGIPKAFSGGFNLLTPQEQHKANLLALRYLNTWLVNRGEPEVTLDGAGVGCVADLY